MAKKPKVTAVIVSILKHIDPQSERSVDGQGQEWACHFEMKLSEPDSENSGRCLRDLNRAIKTFMVHADLEDLNVFEETQPWTSGPYAYSDGDSITCMVSFWTKSTADRTAMGARIRSGVNGALSLMKGAGYKARKRIRPVEQLELVPVNDGDTEFGDPREPAMGDSEDGGAEPPLPSEEVAG